MQEAEAALQPYFALVATTGGKNITIARMEKLMAHIGNPERQLRVVHIAGTSGKTSTTYYTAALLRTTGKKVGHTVSPHIESLAERIAIDGTSLPEDKFCKYLEAFLVLIADAPETPSWFELIIAFTYWVFTQEQVEYAVVETGLGGLQDATNVAARADKLCIITDIGFDHMDVLGNEITSIAYQKAGIVHDGNTVIMYDQSAEIMQVIRYWVSQQENAELLAFEQSRLETVWAGKFIEHFPDYQKRNWLLAFAAYRFIAMRDELPLPGEDEEYSTQRTRIPGRMDITHTDGKTIIMDGAHNAQKMRAFVDSFKLLYPNKKIPLLVALKEGKEVNDIAPIVAEIAQEVILTRFQHMQDVPHQAIEPAKMLPIFEKAKIPKVTVEPDAVAAYEQLLQGVEDIGVVTGSFYLIADLSK